MNRTLLLIDCALRLVSCLFCSRLVESLLLRRLLPLIARALSLNDERLPCSDRAIHGSQFGLIVVTLLILQQLLANYLFAAALLLDLHVRPELALFSWLLVSPRDPVHVGFLPARLSSLPRCIGYADLLIQIELR